MLKSKWSVFRTKNLLSENTAELTITGQAFRKSTCSQPCTPKLESWISHYWLQIGRSVWWCHWNEPEGCVNGGRVRLCEVAYCTCPTGDEWWQFRNKDPKWLAQIHNKVDHCDSLWNEYNNLQNWKHRSIWYSILDLSISASL